MSVFCVCQFQSCGGTSAGFRMAATETSFEEPAEDLAPAAPLESSAAAASATTAWAVTESAASILKFPFTFFAMLFVSFAASDGGEPLNAGQCVLYIKHFFNCK